VASELSVVSRFESTNVTSLTVTFTGRLEAFMELIQTNDQEQTLSALDKTSSDVKTVLIVSLMC